MTTQSTFATAIVAIILLIGNSSNISGNKIDSISAGGLHFLGPLYVSQLQESIDSFENRDYIFGDVLKLSQRSGTVVSPSTREGPPLNPTCEGGTVHNLNWPPCICPPGHTVEGGPIQFRCVARLLAPDASAPESERK